MVVTPSGAQMLPAPGQMVWLTPVFQPPVLRGMTVHPENPLLFDFIVDRGQDKINNDLLKVESTKLIKYFLASMTIPDKDAWVNLSPYEKDRIIPDALGQTEMGRQMLEQDYILKQLASSLTNPDKELGQKFWKEVKVRAKKQFGTTDIPLSTFNKVWIVPDAATVVEKDGFAYITESKLTVMLDEDYHLSSQVSFKGTVPALQVSSKGSVPVLQVSPNGSVPALQGSSKGSVPALQGTVPGDKGTALDVKIEKVGTVPTFSSNDVSKLSTAVFHEMILPKLVEEVNTGKNFAQTRQVYQSVILATWYKKALKDSLLGRIYADKSKVAGVESDVKDIKQKVYDQYLQAFKKGAYNVIKEESNGTDDPIPRKYFSGGLRWDPKVRFDKSSSALNAVGLTIDKAENQIALVSSSALENRAETQAFSSSSSLYNRYSDSGDAINPDSNSAATPFELAAKIDELRQGLHTNDELVTHLGPRDAFYFEGYMDENPEGEFSLNKGKIAVLYAFLTQPDIASRDISKMTGQEMAEHFPDIEAPLKVKALDLARLIVANKKQDDFRFFKKELVDKMIWEGYRNPSHIIDEQYGVNDPEGAQVMVDFYTELVATQHSQLVADDFIKIMTLTIEEINKFLAAREALEQLYSQLFSLRGGVFEFLKRPERELMDAAQQLRTLSDFIASPEEITAGKKAFGALLNLILTKIYNIRTETIKDHLAAAGKTAAGEVLTDLVLGRNLEELNVDLLRDVAQAVAQEAERKVPLSAVAISISGGEHVEVRELGPQKDLRIFKVSSEVASRSVEEDNKIVPVVLNIPRTQLRRKTLDPLDAASSTLISAAELQAAGLPDNFSVANLPQIYSPTENVNFKETMQAMLGQDYNFFENFYGGETFLSIEDTGAGDDEPSYFLIRDDGMVFTREGFKLPDVDRQNKIIGVMTRAANLHSKYAFLQRKIASHYGRDAASSALIASSAVGALKLEKDLSSKDFAESSLFSAKGGGQKADPLGGINFDPSLLNLQIKRDGRGVPLPLADQDWENINIQGLYPVVTKIQAVNVRTLPILGQIKMLANVTPS